MTKHSPAHVQQGNALAPKQQADASRSGECIYQAIGNAHGGTGTAHGASRLVLVAIACLAGLPARAILCGALEFLLRLPARADISLA